AVIEYGSHFELIAKGGTCYNLFNVQQLQQNIEVGKIIVQSEGLLVLIVNGCIYLIFAVIFSNILQSFTKIDNELKRDAEFWSVMFLVIAVGTLICNFIQDTAFGYSGEKLILRVHSATFASILRQNISFFDKERHITGQ
ncbi:12161_t:CDS:2, partial [Racocetra persica]